MNTFLEILFLIAGLIFCGFGLVGVYWLVLQIGAYRHQAQILSKLGVKSQKERNINFIKNCLLFSIQVVIYFVAGGFLIGAVK
ncbi:hypothetical protein PL75_03310 [Neisseria arctica]|uniref:Uncharacterized protein n=1 Tax=Neisseria arctica TaxID=1470200 RepID=A0A0J0YT44_9NEIS|nr:hypothetical protein [Neisseria arctica]KLT73266.1 hypothetical protein PL75_03310 [Neisseria arctica]UOO87478.1 hypothetical protein LVJ86_04335 [Neisseria arctica]